MERRTMSDTPCTMGKSSLRDERVTLRLPASLKQALERAAEQERRSVADIIVFTLEEAMAKRKRRPK